MKSLVIAIPVTDLLRDALLAEMQGAIGSIASEYGIDMEKVRFRFQEVPEPVKTIFVFGSNEAGRHGKGTAFVAAEEYGAIRGQGRGLQGRSYAIPTKDKKLRVRSLGVIKKDVEIFLEFARAHNGPGGYRFNLTRVGCGLARYSDAEMAPLFRSAPTNVIIPEEWKPYHVKG